MGYYSNAFWKGTFSLVLHIHYLLSLSSPYRYSSLQLLQETLCYCGFNICNCSLCKKPWKICSPWKLYRGTLLKIFKYKIHFFILWKNYKAKIWIVYGVQFRKYIKEKKKIHFTHTIISDNPFTLGQVYTLILVLFLFFNEIMLYFLKNVLIQ